MELEVVDLQVGPHREWVTLAQLWKARGIRGEIVADGFGAGPERYLGLRNAVVVSGSGEQRTVKVESAWRHQGQIILGFEGFTTRNDAEAIEGWELRVPAAERRKADEGEFFHSDLIGCRIEEISGAEVGEVVEVQDFGATPLLVVHMGTERGGGEALIPFVRAICTEIDTEGGRIVVDLPEGLIEGGLE